MESKVIYYSNTGNSQAVAAYVGKSLGWETVRLQDEEATAFDKLVLVFPVYCQSIPSQVSDFLRRITVRSLVALATYGKMSYGNVLWEIGRKYRLPLVGGAYLPCRHSYLKGDEAFADFDRLDFVTGCFERGKEITVSKSPKNPFAGFFPVLRSQLGVKLVRKQDCAACSACRCERKTCIRCLRCVYACPQGNLDFRLSFFMRWYLRKKKVTDLVIYTNKE